MNIFNVGNILKIMENGDNLNKLIAGLKLKNNFKFISDEDNLKYSILFKFCLLQLPYLHFKKIQDSLLTDVIKLELLTHTSYSTRPNLGTKCVIGGGKRTICALSGGKGFGKVGATRFSAFGKKQFM